MVGVNILYTYTELSPILALWILVGIAAFVGGIIAWIEEYYTASAICGLIIVVCIGLGVWKETTPRYVMHKITVDETVSYSEMKTVYEPVDAEGSILIVREK